MSYTPTNWATGDTITAAKLNKLEQGVAGAGGGGVLIVTDPDGTLDKTWQEIRDADFAVLKFELPEVIGGGAIFGPLSKASGLGGSFSAVFYIESEGTVEESVYVAETADGYPTLQSQT